MDFVDEEKIHSVIVDPLINRLKSEIIPEIDKVLSDRIVQLGSVISGLLKSITIKFDVGG